MKIWLTSLMICISVGLKASYILLPMDTDQKNHLKAYGITYWVLDQDQEAYWLVKLQRRKFCLLPQRGF